jgi:hypothetical protein
MNRRAVRVPWLLVVLASAADPAAAQLVPPPPVNPASYASRSGEYVLEVDPSEIYGQGAATYRLSRRGGDVWSGTRPFTLIEAKVEDDGVVAGYSYDAGVAGWGKNDALHLLILDSRGAVRHDDVTHRQESRVIDGGPEPNARAMIFDPDNDRVVFRVANVAEPEVWKTYQLSTGKPAPPFTPSSSKPSSDDLSLWVVDAQPVGGTPLTLVHWWRSDWSRGEQGARFTLVEPRGGVAWTLDLPKDYQPSGGDRKAEERLSRLASTTAILDVSQRREFEIRVMGTSERVRYRVMADAKGGWSARETGRQPYVETTKPAEAIEAGPERPLRYLGAIPLRRGGDARSAAVRGVHDFAFDDRGHYGLARQDGGCEATFVTGAAEGEAPREIALGRLGQQSCSGLLVAWAGGRTWLVAAEYASADDGSVGWWVDADSGATRPFTLRPGVSVRAVAGRPGGGVVLLAEQRTPQPYGAVIGAVLLSIDGQGREERGFSEAASDTGSELLNPGLDDITVATTGEVLVVESITHVVGVFDRKGVLQRTIDLEKAWGREPQYPSRVAPDVDGGFIVEDFGAPVPFVRMSAAGTVRADLRPRYEDGRPTGRLFRLRAAPDGSLWGSDGEALLRLDGDGVVERTVGAAAASDHLGEVALLALDGADRIYAADRRTGAVHVFDPDGKLQRICRPEPRDIENALDWADMTVTNDGRVYLHPEHMREGSGYLEFSAAGERVARHAWTDSSRLWNPASGGFWALRSREAALVDEKGRAIQTIARRADRRWLDWISGAVVAHDGSIAVAASSKSAHWEPDEESLNVYTSEGTALRTIRLPAGASGRAFAYDGRSIAFWCSGEVRILDATGRPLARMTPRPGGKTATDWPLVFAAHGRELWMLDAAGAVVYRFEMP